MTHVGHMSAMEIFAVRGFKRQSSELSYRKAKLREISAWEKAAWGGRFRPTGWLPSSSLGSGLNVPPASSGNSVVSTKYRGAAGADVVVRRRAFANQAITMSERNEDTTSNAQYDEFYLVNECLTHGLDEAPSSKPTRRADRSQDYLLGIVDIEPHPSGRA